MPALEAVSDTFTREDALRHLREHVFRSSPDDRRVGIEAELIPVWAESGERVPIVNPDARGMVDLLRAHGRDRDWQEAVSPYGSPRFTVPGGGWISFEPGGQIEWSSAPLTSVAAVAEQACRVIPPLVSSVAAAGVRLVGRGIDPFNPLARCPLLLPSARYARMARYLEAWHPHGARMMRQTAAMHVNLDFGPDPERRFRAAQALVPLLVAVFANSSGSATSSAQPCRKCSRPATWPR